MNSQPESRSRADAITVVILALLSVLVYQQIDTSIRSGELRLEALFSAADSNFTYPSPELTPEQVVHFQVDPLCQTEDVAYGICQCFCFASPYNRSATGPVSRFATLFERPPYDVFVTAKRALVGTAQIEDDQASVLVTMIGPDGRMHAFRFRLARQRAAPFADCWMTDSVRPVDSAQPLTPAVDGTVAPPADSGSEI